MALQLKQVQTSVDMPTPILAQRVSDMKIYEEFTGVRRVGQAVSLHWFQPGSLLICWNCVQFSAPNTSSPVKWGGPPHIHPPTYALHFLRRGDAQEEQQNYNSSMVARYSRNERQATVLRLRQSTAGSDERRSTSGVRVRRRRKARRRHAGTIHWRGSASATECEAGGRWRRDTRTPPSARPRPSRSAAARRWSARAGRPLTNSQLANYISI